MRKILVPTMVILSAFIISACQADNGGDKNTTASQALLTGAAEFQGTYLGTIDGGNILFEVNGKQKELPVSDKIKAIVQKLKVNDHVDLKCTKDSEGELIVTSIDSSSNSNVVQTPSTPAATTPAPAQPQPTTNGNDIYSLTAPTGYKYEAEANNGSKVSSEKNGDYYFEVQVLDSNADIQKQRWQAAADLKPIGPLKELKGTDIPNSNFQDAKFVFQAKNSSVTQTIIVEEKNGILFHYLINEPQSNADNAVDSDLWNIMSGIKVN